MSRVGRQVRASSAATSAVIPRAPPEIKTGSPGLSSSVGAVPDERAGDGTQANAAIALVTDLREAVAHEDLVGQLRGDRFAWCIGREVDHAATDRRAIRAPAS